MARVEAPFRQQPLPTSEPQLTAREGTRIFIHELQGRAVDLLPVVGNHMVDHVHYIPKEWLLGQTLNFNTENDLEAKCIDFLKGNGLEETPDPLFFSDILTSGITVTPSNLWPARKTLLFPWVDFQLQFSFSERAAIIAAPYLVPTRSKFLVNTTRVEGTLYQVDIALGETVPRNEAAITKMAERISWYYGLEDMLGIKDRIDSLVISENSQELLTAFLAARV